MNNRELGDFPVSIGTSLALGTYLVPEETTDKSLETPIVPPEPLEKYSLLMINVRTIIRNARSSFEEIPTQKELDRVVEEDMVNIISIFQNQSIEIKFYINTFISIYRNKKYTSRLRRRSTKRQIEVDTLEKNTLKRYIEADNVLVKDNPKAVPGYDSVIYFTHVPLDLVVHTGYRKFASLRSHTGEVREKSDLHKYYFQTKNVPYDNLPFTMFLLSCFGDSVTFKPHPVKIRKEIVLLGIKKWNVRTTSSTIIKDMKRSNFFDLVLLTDKYIYKL